MRSPRFARALRGFRLRVLQLYVIRFYGATFTERQEDFCDSQFWGHLRSVGRTKFILKFCGRDPLASLGPCGDICANFLQFHVIHLHLEKKEKEKKNL